MTGSANANAYGVLTDPATLKIQRLMPGPVERIWDYLTVSEQRRKWLAAGRMEMKAGTTVELVWRNDELTDPPGQRPAGFSDEHRMESRIIAIDPPRKLVITWGVSGEVNFELEPKGDKVLLTVTHHRFPDRKSLLNVSAGWHAHLDLLVALVTGAKAAPHWDTWSRLREEYEQRLPA